MATQAGYGLDLPGDFDEEQAAIERRKAQLLRAMQTPIGGAGTGWGGGIANFLQGMAGNTLLSGQDTKSKELAQKRAAFAEQAMADLGKLDKPGVPEQVGTGPIAPPPGTPGVDQTPPGGGSTPMNTPEPGPNAPPEAFSATQPLPPDTPAGWIGPGGGMVPQGAEFKPNRAETPMIPGSLSERLKIVSRLAAAGPMYAKVAEKVLTQGLEAPEKAEQARLARADKAEQNALNRASKEEAQAYQRNQQEYLLALKQSQEVMMAAVNSGNKADLAMALAQFKALHAGAGSAGKTQLTGKVDTDGTPLAYDTHTNKLIRVGSGDPPLGLPQSESSAQKGAATVRDVGAAIDRADTAIEKIGKTPDAFGGWGSAGSAVAGLAGDRARGAAENKIYTSDELETRAYIGREGAQILKDLYGAAVTRGEGERAKQFEYMEGLPPEAIVARIKAIRDILKSKVEAQTPAAQSLGRPNAGASGKIRTTPGAPPVDLRAKYNL